MEILLRLFERTLAASFETVFLIGVLLLLTTVLRTKLSSATLHAIWLVFIAKLLLAWLPEPMQRSLRWAALPSLQGGWLDSLRHTEPANLIDSEIFSTNAVHLSSQLVSEGLIQTASHSTNSSEAITQLWLKSALGLWLIGAVVVLIYILIGYLKISGALKAETGLIVPDHINKQLQQLQKQMGIRPRVRIQLSQQTSTPALFGLFKPVVLVPHYMQDQLSEAEWECVLRHELTHFKRMDVQVNLLAVILAAFHWFNPIVWYGLSRMRVQQELACDDSVLQAAPPIKDTYAACIVKMLEIGEKQRMSFVSASFSGYKNQIARRLIMIKNFQAKKKRLTVIGLLVLIATAILTLPSAFAANGGNISVDEYSFQLPAAGDMTTSFGDQTYPNNSNPVLHDGIDIANLEGTAVHAAEGGKIIKAEYHSLTGLTIIIEHNASWKSEYRHLSELNVQLGQVVSSGEQIGFMGSTGQSTGSHLHFSTIHNGKYVDPAPLFKK
ncbi:M56 family metallopeptidase [Paenibacillus luteus]|uniref:M56 family metallopeptidase n=1 Tax=Paenibacillus luteus TaxID=2545753 RepID=UPI001141ED8E|nr:M23/M56 family metallopeptidase [Paenibacillus luteus]